VLSAQLRDNTHQPEQPDSAATVASVDLLWMFMAFPIKICSICSEEFELKPDKPGFANRCPDCSAEDADVPASKGPRNADQRKADKEANEARREAMRNLLYRKDT
jgi:hypothetical protein